MELARQQMVEAASQTRHPVRQLVDEGPLPGGQRPGLPAKGDVQAKSPRYAFLYPEGRPTGLGDVAQSSIPVVGDEGTAISRDGIRPAR